MRLVSRDTLLTMPSGTVYSDYNDGVIDGLYKKGDTIINDDNQAIDWHLIDVLDPEFNGNPYEIIEELEHGGEISYESDYERDSTFDDSAMYLVYSAEDVQKIIAILQPE